MTEICRSCGECRHWRPQKIQSTAAEKSGKGYCAAHPPQISDRLVEKNYVQGLVGCELALKCSWWPATDKSDGCGEFQSKMEVANG
jgi:hypothetical protein